MTRVTDLTGKAGKSRGWRGPVERDKRFRFEFWDKSCSPRNDNFKLENRGQEGIVEQL